MKAERAAEILDQATNKGEELKAQIVEAILQACSEQREIDAKICEEHYTIEETFLTNGETK